TELFIFSSRRRHTRSKRDWSSDVCSSDLFCGNIQSSTRKIEDHQRRQKYSKLFPCRRRCKTMKWNGLLNKYKDYLPVTDHTPELTLHEGNTPRLHFPNLSEELNIELYGKIEGANPTGSFKDRGMVMAVDKAVEDGSDTVICSSTGNTSASAAAYAAKAGLRAIIAIPKGKVALGKLAQAVMHGAEIVEIEGNFDDALKMVQQASETLPITLVNSVNPY